MPRINPAPSPAINNSTTVNKSAVSKPAGLPQNVAQTVAPPLPAKNASRPVSRDETPLLAEQAAFQLPASFVQDVQRVANQTGYVGLTPNAIQRAYLQGEGLFVDTSA
jgi:hypothetical protein